MATITNISKGAQNWDVQVNANFSELDTRTKTPVIANLQDGSGQNALQQKDNTANGRQSFATGCNNVASGENALAGGYNNKVNGVSNFACNAGNVVNGSTCVAIGLQNTINDNCENSFAGGTKNTVDGLNCNFVFGDNNILTNTLFAKNLTLIGSNLETPHSLVPSNSVVIGKFNKPSTTPMKYGGTAFIIGFGDDEATRKNVFRAGTEGVFGTGAYNSTGADIAEYFEWVDGNHTQEDRVAHFVTLDGDKIRYTNENDNYILGVVSAIPSLIGDSFDDQWQGQFLTDIFGRNIYEEVEVPAEKEIIDEKEVIKIPSHKEDRQKLNPNFNPNKEYIPRSQRPEWSAIGHRGKLAVYDNGECQVNQYCKAGNGGIAIPSTEKTKYRVMSRINENLIKIWVE